MEKKPNVVIIMADQLRYDMLEKGITPNIRQIAEEGVEFNTVIVRVHYAFRPVAHSLPELIQEITEA